MADGYAQAKGRPSLVNLHADTPGLELPGLDILGIASGYGIPATRIETLSYLTQAVKDGLSADGPQLIEVDERRLGDL